MELAANARSGHQEAQAEGLGEPLGGGLDTVSINIVDSRPMAITEGMPVFMRERRAAFLDGMVAVDTDAEPQFGRIREHSGDLGWQLPVKHAKTDLCFQQLP